MKKFVVSCLCLFVLTFLSACGGEPTFDSENIESSVEVMMNSLETNAERKEFENNAKMMLLHGLMKGDVDRIHGMNVEEINELASEFKKEILGQ